MMKLSQRMMSCFCKSIFPLDEQRWSTTYHGSVCIAMYGRTDTVVLSAATSVHLPSSPDTIVTFLKNKHNSRQVLFTLTLFIYPLTTFSREETLNVCHHNGAYCLKYSSRVWFGKLSQTMTKHGFFQVQCGFHYLPQTCFNQECSSSNLFV